MSEQGIQTAINRMNKISYMGLTKIEYNYIKLFENKGQIEKALYGFNGFYCTAPKNENGSIDFKKCNNQLLDNFHNWNKELESVSKKIDNLIKKYNLDELDIVIKFNSTKNLGYGGSF